MTTTEENYAAAFARQSANDIQRKAVEQYLVEHREINRDYAYDIGLPACGRIKNIGARIHDMRKDGWHINTRHTGRGVLVRAYQRARSAPREVTRPPPQFCTRKLAEDAGKAERPRQ